MLKKHIKELINGKKILIMGFGREGRSTYRVIKEVGGYNALAVSDMNNITDIDEKVYFGENYQDAAKDFDIIFKSPGVVLENRDFASKVTSQTDEIMNCYKKRMIGITGTKGKSTTTSLIYHILLKSGKNPCLMGNIGIPAFDATENLDDNSLLVYELSCHQLEFAKSSPHIGVLLNIFPEHLDHYGTFERYANAKKNIYMNMLSDDLLFCGYDVAPKENVNATTFSMDNSDADYYVTEAGTKHNGKLLDFSKLGGSLFGVHNMYNVSVAYAVCTECGVTFDEFSSALKTFKTLPHRLELFLEKDGITYFDDSISTIPETTIQALSSIENVGTIILGGMDRNIPLELLAEFLIKNPVKNIVLMPDTGYRIKNLLDGKCKSNINLAENLEEATKLAVSLTSSGEACVLSPAAASYGFFKNFEERGEAFKKYVFDLTK